MACCILEKVNNLAWLEQRENVYEDLLEEKHSWLTLLLFL